MVRKTIRPPDKSHGGKHHRCERIIAQFPTHETYVEPFAGPRRALAEVLRQCAGKVMLSGYPWALYRELNAGWRVAEFDMPKHAVGGKQKTRKRECLWLNFG
jgi:site-specific DNA-adenine methylase